MDKNGLVVVKRSTNFFDKGLINCQEAEVVNQDIFKRYKGFDGEIWPDSDRFEGLAHITDIEEVIDYYKSICLKNINSYFDLIYLNKDSIQLNIPNFIFGGYDFGYFISKYNYYSVLLNEVIFGREAKMKKFTCKLNANLLISNLKILEELKIIREENSLKSRD
jgi:hypothetical protein